MKKRTMIFILALCMVLASLPLPVSAASVVTKLEIEDAIAPINGKAPVTSLKETDQYTGSIEWEGNPQSFVGDSTYTATITLTTKEGYTFEGVAENAFNVNSAKSSTNLANSGVITATFKSPPEGFVTDGNGHIAYKLPNFLYAYHDLCPIYTHNGDWSTITLDYEPYAIYYMFDDFQLYRASGDFIKEPVPINNDFYIQLIPELCEKGKLLRLNYLLKNEGKSERKYSIANRAIAKDSQGQGASLTKFTDGTGFYMKDRMTGAIVNFFGKNGNVSDIDRFYFGGQSSAFSQVAGNSYSGGNVYLAHSWIDRTVSPGETILLSFTIGVGTRENSEPLPAVVTFNSKGGSLVPSITVPLNEKATEPATPIKDGLTFAGWFTDQAYSNEHDFNTPVTENITLYAKWSESIYTVTFDSKGGSTVDSQTITQNEKVTEPTAPTKVGYTFAGWFTDQEYTNEYDFNTPVTENITLYAKWIANTYTVTFDSKGGSDVESQSIEYNEKATTPTAPTKVGYTFAGWFTDQGYSNEYDFNTPVTENITLYAKWTENLTIQHRVSFNSNGGTGNMNSEEVEEGTEYTLPANGFTAPDGKEFASWKVGNETVQPGQTITVNEDTEVIAQWADVETPVNTYTVTYDSNGGTSVTTETVQEGETATEPTTPTRKGYIFESWYKDGVAWDFDTIITENITLVAQWTEEEEPPADEYRITVIGGRADKRFAKEGDVINITANSNRNFNIWTSTPQVSIKNYRNFNTSFVMGAHDVTIKANYISYESTPSHPHFPSTSYKPEPIKQRPLDVPREIKVEQDAVFVIGSKILVKNINGTESRIEMDVEPFISENRTMIPIRFVAEALGFDVSWDNTTRTVILTDKNNKVEIPVDTNKIIVNGKTYESDVAPVMKNNRTYLSISNVAKALGLKEGTEIIWKEDTKEVIIKRTVSMK